MLTLFLKTFLTMIGRNIIMDIFQMIKIARWSIEFLKERLNLFYSQIRKKLI